MKATGIVRKVDELGRIVIPKELRGDLNIDIRDPLEIYTEDEFIILKNICLAVYFAAAWKTLEASKTR